MHVAQHRETFDAGGSNSLAINVDTSDGVATLSGVVASGDERKRALQLARDTEGITRVVDELEVRKP